MICVILWTVQIWEFEIPLCDIFEYKHLPMGISFGKIVSYNLMSWMRKRRIKGQGSSIRPSDTQTQWIGVIYSFQPIKTKKMWCIYFWVWDKIQGAKIRYCFVIGTSIYLSYNQWYRWEWHWSMTNFLLSVWTIYWPFHISLQMVRYLFSYQDGRLVWLSVLDLEPSALYLKIPLDYKLKT